MDDEFDAMKQAQLRGVAETIGRLESAETCAGASLILGLARGRIDVLLDIGLLGESEYTALRAAFRERFEQRWPYLIDELTRLH